MNIAKRIVDIINTIPYNVYAEPFCGSGAVYWAKGIPFGTKQSNFKEVLNDTNHWVTSFFEVLRDEKLLNQLIEKIELTPYSSITYQKCKQEWRDNDPNQSIVDKAYSFYVHIQFSFGSKMNGGYAMARHANTNHAKEYYNHVEQLKSDAKRYIERMRFTYIDDRDALWVMDYYDSVDTLFYIDPPYVDTDQGHYKGYTVEHYMQLLEKIGNCKASVILSGYANRHVPSEWRYIDIQKLVSVNNVLRKTAMERVWVIDRSKKNSVGNQILIA